MTKIKKGDKVWVKGEIKVVENTEDNVIVGIKDYSFFSWGTTRLIVSKQDLRRRKGK